MTFNPTPEQIKAAAEAIRKVECRSALISDVDLPTYKARAALVAAQGAAPVLPSSGVDEEKLAEVKARALEDAANDLRVSFSRGAAIAMHHQCHKKQCRCGNPGNDEIVRAVFEAAREELRARAEAYRQEREEQ